MMFGRRKPKRVEVYEDVAGKWRWRVIARNGQEIGRSEQGYATRRYCRRVAVERNPGLPVVVEWP